MRSLILTAAAALMLAGHANAQFSISSFTIDGGGGKSSGGTFSLTGTVGQAEASAPSTGSSFSLAGGFWGLEIGGFAAWADMNIPAGQDRSFTGDADGDGISNGLQYAFGNVKGEILRPGVLEAPTEPVPGDVRLILQGSFQLASWESLLRWEYGTRLILTPELSIVDGEVRDSLVADKYFYRWTVHQ